MKRPAYQWYPGDIRRDTALQACSFEARALWREMLDLMHDGEPYGHLTAGGVAIDDATLARIVGVPVTRVRAWMKQLEAHKVFSRNDDGVIYSRRMVKDEHIRNVRGESGKKGGNPALLVNQNPSKPEANPEQTVNQSPTPAVALAVATAKEEQTRVIRVERPPDYPPEFEAVWAVYPRRAGGNPKKDAYSAWRARLNAGVPADTLHAGTERYAAFCHANDSTGTEFVMQAKKFFGTSDLYLEPWTPGQPKGKQEPPLKVVNGWFA